MTTTTGAAEHPYADMPQVVQRMIPVLSYDLIQEILGSRDFALGGRDHTRPFLLGTIGLLEGDQHLARRRLEAGLFRPAMLSTLHRANVESAARFLLEDEFGDANNVEVDLVEFVFATETLIMAKFVGIELPGDDLAAAVRALVPRMRHVNDGQSLVWSRGDPVQDAWRVRRELLAFAEAHLKPAIERAFARDRSTPPQTVIETLVDGYDPTTWDGELITRESWTYMAAGVQTSTYAILDALVLLIEWLDAHPQDRVRALDASNDFLYNLVAESLRLNVPNPAIFRIALRSGVTASGFAYEEGQQFALYTGIADRDTDVFGNDAEEFNPDRQMPEGVPRWGFAFGHGHHACIGRPLAVGRTSGKPDSLFEGSTISILRTLVGFGVALVPGDPPTLRDDTFKSAYKRFPVKLARDPGEAT